MDYNAKWYKTKKPKYKLLDFIRILLVDGIIDQSGSSE